MENDIVEELLKKCNWYEKIIIVLFRKLLNKFYNIVRIRIINIFLEDKN